MNDESSANPIDAAIATLRAQREKIDQALQALESVREIVNLTGVPLGIGVPPPGSVAPTILGSGLGHTSEIAPGAFHGMGIQEAVRKLLLMRKRTMSAPELSQDLHAGGLDFAPKSITSVLHRAFVSGGDIVRRERGQWGLQEWYPNQRFNRRGES
jgi:hypothetical protein